LVRIEGPEMARYVPLVHDGSVAQYDVIVDDAPSSPNQKEQVFAILMQMLPGLMKAGIPMPPELLDYTPLPTSLVEKWKNTIQQKSQQPQQDPKMMAMQAQLAMGQQKAQADIQVNQQKAQADQQHQQMQFIAGAEDDKRRAALEQQIAMQQMQLDRDRAQAQIAIQRDKMHADIIESQMRAQADIEIARQKAFAQQQLAERTAAQRQPT
jgi:hypothetical protein